MNTLIWVAILVVFIFLLTYDPKSGRLGNYITPQSKKTVTPPVMTEDEYECDEQSRYHEAQFNTPGKKGCTGKPREYMGAVI